MLPIIIIGSAPSPPPSSPPQDAKPTVSLEQISQLAQAIIGHDDKALEQILHNHSNMIHEQVLDEPSPLFLACKIGFVEGVKLLIRIHASLVIAIPHGNITALHVVLLRRTCSLELALDVIRTLCDSDKDLVHVKARVLRISDTNEWTEQTPVYTAAVKGDCEVVKLLHQYGALLNEPSGEDNVCPLHAAVTEGHLDVFSYLVEKGSDVFVATKKGETPLYMACKKGADHFIEILSQCYRKASCTTLDDLKKCLYISVLEAQENSFELLHSSFNYLVKAYGNEILPIAVRGGSVVILMALLAELNVSQREAEMLLLEAVEWDHDQIVIELLERFNVINATNERDNTALHIAIKTNKKNSLKIAEALLKAGAATGPENNYQDSPLSLAIALKIPEFVELLANHGADLNAEIGIIRDIPLLVVCSELSIDKERKKTVQIFKTLLLKGADISKLGHYGYNLMHWIARNNKIDILEWLVALEVLNEHDWTVCTAGGDTSLALAVAAGHFSIADRLLQLGAPAELQLPSEFLEVLQIVVARKLFELSPALEARIRCQTEVIPTTRWSNLALACFFNKESEVRILIQAGIDLEEKSGNNEETALHIAARRGHRNIVDLLKNVANINAKAKDGSTPLYYAVLHDDAGPLLDAKASLEETYGPENLTILHIAILNRCYAAAIDLVIGGANPHAKCKDGYTPFYRACQECLDPLVKLLLERGARIDESNGNEKCTVRHFCLTRKGGEKTKQLFASIALSYFIDVDEYKRLTRAINEYLNKSSLTADPSMQEIKESIVKTFVQNIKEAIVIDLEEVIRSYMSAPENQEKAIHQLKLIGEINKLLLQLALKKGVTFSLDYIARENHCLDVLHQHGVLTEDVYKIYFPNYFAPSLIADIWSLILPKEIDSLISLRLVSKTFRTAATYLLKTLLHLPGTVTFETIQEEILNLRSEISTVQKNLPDDWLSENCSPLDSILNKMTTFTTEDVVRFFRDIKASLQIPYLELFLKRTLASQRRSLNCDPQVEQARGVLIREYLLLWHGDQVIRPTASASLVPLEILFHHGENNIQFIDDLPSNQSNNSFSDLLIIFYRGCKKSDERKKIIDWAANQSQVYFLEMLAEDKNIHDPDTWAYVLCIMGIYYAETSCPRDYQKAFDLLLKAAELGNPQAKFELVACYREGKGVDRNEGEAFRWLFSAAASDHAQAQFELAKSPSVENAIAWLKRAANGKNVEAQMSLAVCYFNGTGVGQNFDEAFVLLEKAANQMNGLARRYLLHFFKDGLKTSQEKKLAFDMYLNQLRENPNNAEVLCQIAECYLNGGGVFKDNDKAMEFLKRAVEHQHAKAQYLLGISLAEDRRSGSESLELFRKAAAQNYPPARFALAKHIFKCGRLEEAIKHLQEVIKAKVESDLLRAAFYYLGKCYNKKKQWIAAAENFTKSAELGLRQAQYHLGLCYFHDRGLNQNFQNAFVWMEAAAKQEYHFACEFLKYFYKEGRDTSQQLKIAFDMHRTRAGQNDRESQYLLAMCYFRGEGTYANPAKAFEYLCKSAQQQHKGAQYQLGLCYLNGDLVEKDEAIAFSHFSKASQQSHDEATYYYAICYLEGKGVAENTVEAVRLLSLIARKGHALAQYALAICLLEGTGIGIDNNRGIQLLESLRERGEVEAEYQLGVCYLLGKGVGKDEYRAFALFKKAAEAGYIEAEYHLGLCYLRGLGVDKDETAALDWLRKAAEKGHIEGQYELGLLFSKDQTWKCQNIYEANFWLRRASEMGHEDAKNLLRSRYKSSLHR